MSYEIRPGRPLSGEVVRIARAQYGKAIDVLGKGKNDRYRAIHDARKRFKRLRGLFRLVRDGQRDLFDAENARLRAIAGSLSAARDATALVEAMDRLLESESSEESREALLAVRGRLAERRDRIVAEEVDLSGKVAAAIVECMKGMDALDGIDLPKGRGKAIALLAAGAAKNYARAIRAFETARKSGNQADWHDMRKRIKYHGMHVLLLRPAWPGEMAIRAKVADRAGEALGDDHDLANLCLLMAAEPEVVGGATETRLLRAAIAERSRRLHEQVRMIVKDLLRDEPKLFERRIAMLCRDADR
ncbi:CHAD domain-containing protein [Oricola thermophila]|uniref:CHAD domain-containing protein n=1 Tax=Oricola thermophila TaxID=2742145 RepID=A0A6N1VIE7_9HYPH|nr:CHAD domain-containing protein [Oricola thermophila]QKV19495.1 CHAD domain-containing protein [Oricola thermophila]